ncbi:MAG TPA: hypothetical protein VHA10_18480 [Hypericibacter adhaerens]|jgi:hypothetical protein|uniref:Uncharacterized protein n=1 Tax=Hypericibacter adhaerens TaxID=2602016 RepID=A0A5J6MWH1_9PROT|nr:hypothetical protein [Hypericibacter adhaerens]QEX21968.1 hypothetical protein FRZ61_18970 [Hypericibacter adhaerens]HWA45214.1 hypothetical protein [Hypericibacter adhaerens]
MSKRIGSKRIGDFVLPALLACSLLLSAGRMAIAADPGPAIPLPDADRAQIEKLLGKGVVGDPVPAPPLQMPTSYAPREGTVLTYLLRDAKGKSWSEAHRIASTTDSRFSPGFTYSIEKVKTEFMQAADGGLVIAAEEDLKEKVLTRFTPGQPLIVGGLKAGESRQVKVDVKVADLSDPTDITHTGSLDITYSYVGAYKVTVPAGSYEAALIRWDYQGKVGPASIKDTYYRLIAPGAGLIAMIEDVSISAMLVYNDDTKLAKQLERIE